MKVLNLNGVLDALTHATTFILITLLGTLNPQVGFFFLAFFADTLFGAYIAHKNKEFSKKYFITKTLEKLVIYVVIIFFGHAGDMIANFKDKIRDIVLLGLFVKEAPSFLAKLKKLGYAKEAEILEQNLPKPKESKEQASNEGSETKDDGEQQTAPKAN